MATVVACIECQLHFRTLEALEAHQAADECPRYRQLADNVQGAAQRLREHMRRQQTRHESVLEALHLRALEDAGALDPATSEAELAALRLGAMIAGVEVNPLDELFPPVVRETARGPGFNGPPFDGRYLLQSPPHTHKLAYYCRCRDCERLRVQVGLPAEPPPEEVDDRKTALWLRCPHSSIAVHLLEFHRPKDPSKRMFYVACPACKEALQ